MKEIKWYSAAALTKKSCSKIMFDELHKLPVTVSEKMIRGEAWQKAQTVSDYVEMSNSFVNNNIGINYSFDEIIIGRRDFYMYEHKMVEDKSLSEEWFFHSSLIQVAFYGSLHRHSKRPFKTASFVDGPHHELVVPWHKTKYRLNFGGDLYSVRFCDMAVLRFFLSKARRLDSWVEAKQFDLTYSKKEWPNYFKDYIAFSRVRPLKGIK